MAGPRHDPNLRIGDAERAAMSDTLGKHYSEGRLDEAELRERLGRASAAKTYGDLEGLLSDLPPVVGEAMEPTPARAPAKRRHTGALRLVVLAVFALWLSHALFFWGWPFFLPHLMVAALVVGGFLLLRERHHRHRAWRGLWGGCSGCRGPAEPPYGRGA